MTGSLLKIYVLKQKSTSVWNLCGSPLMHIFMENNLSQIKYNSDYLFIVQSLQFYQKLSQLQKQNQPSEISVWYWSFCTRWNKSHTITHSWFGVLKTLTSLAEHTIKWDSSLSWGPSILFYFLFSECYWCGSNEQIPSCLGVVMCELNVFPLCRGCVSCGS